MKNLKLFLLSTVILFSFQVFAMEESQEDLNKKLVEAINNINLYKVQTLIEAGADINTKGYLGFTALMRAAWDGEKAVKHLIDYCQSNNIKLNVNTKNIYGLTALMMAIKKIKIAKVTIKHWEEHDYKQLKINPKFQFKAIKYLVLIGANINDTKEFPSAYQVALNIQNTVKILFILLKNSKDNRSQIVNLIKSLALQVPIRFISDRNGNNLLHLAAKKEDIELFGFIYSICPSLVATTNNRNQTPVQFALGNKKIFELIKKLASQNDNQTNYNDKPKAQPCNLF